MASALGIMVISMNKIPEDMISKSLGLLIVSSALVILANAFKTMGSMNWEDINKGLTALAGAFTILGIAGFVLDSVVSTILLLSGAVTLFGIGVAALGAGILALSIAFTTMSGASAAWSASLAFSLNNLMGLIPTFFKRIGEGIVEFSKAIGSSATTIAEQIGLVVNAILNQIKNTVPNFINTIDVVS